MHPILYQGNGLRKHLIHAGYGAVLKARKGAFETFRLQECKHLPRTLAGAMQARLQAAQPSGSCGGGHWRVLIRDAEKAPVQDLPVVVPLSVHGFRATYGTARVSKRCSKCLIQ